MATKRKKTYTEIHITYDKNYNVVVKNAATDKTVAEFKLPETALFARNMFSAGREISDKLIELKINSKKHTLKQLA